MFAQAKVLLLCSLSLSVAACSAAGARGGRDGAETASFSDDDLAVYNDGRYGDGNIPYGSEDGPFKTVLFDYDSAAVPQEYHAELQKNAQSLKEDPTLKVEIEGHSDKRGTNEYNLALGEERAKAVAKLLVSFGASAAQLSTISYGEEIPVAQGDSEEAYKKNRRAHFVVFKK